MQDIDLNNPPFTEGCPRCGIHGIHACPGTPVSWTEETKTELKTVMGDILGWLTPGPVSVEDLKRP